MSGVRIKLNQPEAEALLCHVEQTTGIPREVWDELAEVFIAAYEQTPRFDARGMLTGTNRAGTAQTAPPTTRKG